MLFRNNKARREWALASRIALVYNASFKIIGYIVAEDKNLQVTIAQENR
jgi:hypothetical protein